MQNEHRGYAGPFSTEQYRAVPRPWPEGVHLEIESEEPLPLISNDPPSYIMDTMIYDGGPFGIVSRVCDAFTNKWYARKEQIVSPEISMTLAAQTHLRDEALRLKSIKHKHVVHFVKSYQRGESFGMLLEPAATTDLQRLLRRYARDLPEYRVMLRPALLTAFGCLSRGLAHIHGAKIHHKDIKPSNILYVAGTKDESANFLWADIGLASDFSTSSRSRTRDTRMYSARYAAPELADHEDNKIDSSLSIGPAGHGKSSDVFSLGCVFLEILARLVQQPLPLDDKPTGSSDVIPTFYNHLGKLRVWVNEVMNLDSDLEPLFIIAEEMIAISASERPVIDQVVRSIDCAGQEFFCEDCCIELSKQRRTSTTKLLLPPATAIGYPWLNRSETTTVEAISGIISSSSSYVSPSTIQTVEFIIHWDLQEYLQKELDIDQDSNDAIRMLCNVLTITGTANEAYATTLEDYMSWKWRDACIDIPSIFRSVIGEPSTCKCISQASLTNCARQVLWFLISLSLALLKSRFMLTIPVPSSGAVFNVSKGTSGETCIVVKAERATLILVAEQLAWLSAVLRVSKQDEISSSEVSFRVLLDKTETFEIIPLDLQKVEEDSSTCWLPLFKGGIIASGFPIPERAGQKGIELPFSLMTDQSGMLYPMTYKEGIYLRGFSSLLYPTAQSDDGISVQWHLIESSSAGKYLAAGTLPEFDSTGNYESHWARCTDIKKLASAQRTFLGYCKHVTVNLGTTEGTEEAVLSHVAHSKADNESPHPGLQLKTLNTGFPGAGLLSFVASAEIVRPKGLTHAANERKRQRFLGMCELNRDRPIIIYDEARNIGWLVPTLSVILHMAHLWASGKKDLIASVPHATAQWDAGEAALATIKANVDRELRDELTGEQNLCMRNLVEDFMVSLDEKFEIQTLAMKDPKPTVRAERTKLYGWDLLDIVKSKPSRRKQLGMSEGWMKLSEDILVLLCQEVGQIIRPAQDTKLCNSWNPIPTDHQYLIATVSCLQHLSKARGGHQNDACLRLTNSAYWLPTSASLFADCPNTETQTSSNTNCTCNKAPQHIIGKHGSSKNAARPPNTGAVVFGTRKLQKADPAKKVQLHTNEHAVSVLAHVDRDTNGTQVAKSKKKRTRLSRIWAKWKAMS